MNRVLAAAAVVAVALSSAPATAAITVQEAILRAKPGVVLITAEVRAEVTMNCGKGPVTAQPSPLIETGTGWFVDGRGWVITNGHVVDPAYRIPAWVQYELKKKAIEEACVDPALRARGLTRGQRPEIEERIRRNISEVALAKATVTPLPELTVALANGTKLRAEVKKFSAPLLLDSSGRPLPDSGRDLALLKVADGTYPALEPAVRDVQIGDPVHILGFPGVVLSHELLSRSVSMEASVTSGAISGFKQDAIGQDVIQTDAPAAYGNSGGPAISNESNVVGVLTFVSLSATGGSIVQGFNFLIPAKDVRAFLQGTEVHPGESAFNPVLAAGLSALFTDRYRTAVSKLRDANALLPGLPDVKRALAEAETKLENRPARPFPWAWATLGITLLSVGVYGGMAGRKWWKNRFRVLPTQVIGFIENGSSPVLVDARTKTDYETSPLTLPRAIRVAPEDAEAGRVNLDIDRDQLVITYCTSPGEQTSAQVAQLLRQRGYRNLRILKGGLGAWTNARLPVEAKSHLPSIGLEIYKSLTIGDVERRSFAAGDTIFRQGDDARGEAYVVHAGAVEIRKRIDGTDRVLGRLGEGELLGEMALFRKAPRSASAVAATDVELLIVKAERLEWLIRNRPQLTLEILKRLSDWVVATDQERGEASVR